MKVGLIILVFTFFFKLSFSQTNSRTQEILMKNYWVPETIEWDSGGFGFGNIIEFPEDSVVRIVYQPFCQRNDSIVAWATDMNYKKGKWFFSNDSILINCKLVYSFYNTVRLIIDEETNETTEIKTAEEFNFTGKIIDDSTIFIDNVKYINSNRLTYELKKVFKTSIDQREKK